MGIYVFKKDVLVQLLKHKYPGSNDFGGEIIPMAAAEGQKVIAYLFNDYWEDIGTMKSFFDANLALAQTVGHFATPHCFRLSANFACMVDSDRWIYCFVQTSLLLSFNACMTVHHYAFGNN